MLLNCRKLLRILMIASLLHLGSSTISEVVKDLLSIISRIRTNFEGESLKAISPEIITGWREASVLIVTREEEGAEAACV